MENVLFNDALNTFYIVLAIRTMNLKQNMFDIKLLMINKLICYSGVVNQKYLYFRLCLL